MRRSLFIGAYANRERRSFKRFIENHLKEHEDEINRTLVDMVFHDEINQRTSKILQQLFLVVYEKFLKNDEKLASIFVEEMRIRYDKDRTPLEVLNEIADYIRYRR